MQVTFTGIKNIGFIKTSIDYANLGIIKENDQGWKRIFQMTGPDFQLEEGYLLNMQLTDDFNGKHYTEFQKALEKSHLKTSNFRNPIHKNFLNIFSVFSTLISVLFLFNCSTISSLPFIKIINNIL